MITIMGVGMTFVISTGQIDLSVGSITALSSITTAMVLRSNLGIILASVVGLGTGLLVGLANGLITTKFKIPPFLVTLGMMEVVRGLAMWITHNAPIPIINQNTIIFWFRKYRWHSNYIYMDNIYSYNWIYCFQSYSPPGSVRFSYRR